MCASASCIISTAMSCTGVPFALNIVAFLLQSAHVHSRNVQSYHIKCDSRKHQCNVPFEFIDRCDMPITDPASYSLEVHRSLDDFMVIRCVTLNQCQSKSSLFYVGEAHAGLGDLPA